MTEPPEEIAFGWGAPEHERTRVRVSQEELERHFAPERRRPTLTVDYIAESGGTKMHWPKTLEVDQSGSGPVRALLTAFYGREPTRPRRKDSERAEFGFTTQKTAPGLRDRLRTIDVEHVGAIDLAEFPLAAPAGRLIGRANIARWLGLKDPDQVTQYALDYPWIIRKIGALFIADTAALITDLDEIWRQHTATERAAAGRSSAAVRRRGR